MNKPKTIKHIPDKLWLRLKAQASREHKIFSFFVIELLEKAIDKIENDKLKK